MMLIKKEFIVLAFVIGGLACTKNDPPVPTVQTAQWNWELMSNPTDPLFAHVKNDSLEWEMYGQRDARGLPARLSTVIYRSHKDTVFFHFDSVGRPVGVRTSKQITYLLEWAGGRTLDPWMSSDLEEYHYGLATESDLTDIPVPDNPVLPVHTASNNISVDVWHCTEQDAYGQMIVAVGLRSGVHEKELYFPAQFNQTRYEASVPLQIPATLLPSAEYTASLIRVMSFPHKVFTHDGKWVLAEVCDRLTASADASPFSDSLRQSVYASNNLVKRVFEQYCSITAAPDLSNRLDTASWRKRGFAPGVVIRPIVYRLPETVAGEPAAVQLGMENKTFSVDVGCNALYLNNPRWRGYYTTDAQPDVQVPVYFKITVLNDLTAKAEWSTTPGDFSRFVFKGTTNIWGNYLDWSDGNGFSFPNAWMTQNGTIQGTVKGCIDCNQPTTYKFWLRRY